MSNKSKNLLFEIFFWTAIVFGTVLTLAVLVLCWLVYAEGAYREHAGVSLATGALALFTGLLWLAAAITARFARREISTSTAVNSADLTLQLDNRFNSDRALRIRHGAVRFLVETKHELDVEIPCEHDISAYRTTQEGLWCGLSSDVIDLFNYFDWIGYLTSDRSNAIERDVIRRKIGPALVNYYQICNEEIEEVQLKNPARWPYLKELYDDVIAEEEQLYKDRGKVYAEDPADKEKRLSAWLQREHVRTHRGSAFIEASPEAMSGQQD